MRKPSPPPAPSTRTELGFEELPEPRHWTHYVLWPLSRKLYCRYWSAHIAWRCVWSIRHTGGMSRWIPVWPVFVWELLRRKQTIRIRVNRGKPVVPIEPTVG